MIYNAEIKDELVSVKASRVSTSKRSNIPRDSKTLSSASIRIDTFSGKEKHLQTIARTDFHNVHPRREWDSFDVLNADWHRFDLKNRAAGGVIYSLGTSDFSDALHEEVEEGLSSVFFVHAEKWKNETMFVSSTEEIILHRSYQRIIGLGPKVLPLIFKDLEETHSHWFWALESITGEDQAKTAQDGDIEAMTKKWLNWAKLNGYR